MRVAICCKAVPVGFSQESVQILEGDIRLDGDLYINEIDAYALEAAIALKERYHAETVALTLGPLRALEVLYIALAKGIDRVLRIDGEVGLPELIASGLVPALKELAPDLVLAGVQSEDWMGGEVGIYLSQALQMSSAYAVVEILEVTETHVRVKKEIGGGKKAEIKLRLPGVLCVQSGIQPLRYVSAMRRQKVRNTPIRSWGRFDRQEAKKGLSGMMNYRLVEILPPSREGSAQMIEGDRPERARKVLQIITGTV